MLLRNLSVHNFRCQLRQGNWVAVSDFHRIKIQGAPKFEPNWHISDFVVQSSANSMCDYIRIWLYNCSAYVCLLCEEDSVGVYRITELQLAKGFSPSGFALAGVWVKGDGNDGWRASSIYTKTSVRRVTWRVRIRSK